MPPDTVQELDALSEFDQRHSRAGRLEYYAQYRVYRFNDRMMFAGLVALAVVFLIPWHVAVIALSLTFLGEWLDHAVMRRVPGLLASGRSVTFVHRLTVASAALQAMGVAGFVILIGLSVDSAVSALFCIAFLTAASVDVCGVLPFHRAAVLIRLAIYGPVGLALIAHRELGNSTLGMSFDILGVLILGAMVAFFMQQVTRAHSESVENSRSAIATRVATEFLNANLMEQEAELRRLSLVARHARDSVIVAGPDRRILWVNNAFVDQTGFTKEEVLGKRGGDLLNGPETDLEVLAEIGKNLQMGRAYRAEVLHYTKDHHKLWVDLQCVPVFGDTGEIELFISVERDITQARVREYELAQAKVVAEDGARAKSAFLATMSHEIRTPMNGIIGMAELIARAPLNDELRLYVSTIRESADALLKIINDILDLSKLDANKLTIEEASFSLRDCVFGVANLLRGQALEKGLTLDIDIIGKIPNTLAGDDGRIRQILLNLIGNAVKFTETGGVVLTVRHSEKDGAHHVQLDIQDTGIGIPPDRLDHIFEQFAQADGATNRRFGGTGLGLSISRQLARRMGGDITATSVPGQGSCFTVALALGTADTAPATTPVDTVPAQAQATEGQTILVAEDNRTNRLLMRKFLQDLPIDLHFAVNGAEAVAQTQALHPDLIFMDMSMPEMDGIEATRHIRLLTIPRQPHIVALTANAFDTDRRACLDAGMNDFLAKPVRRAQLVKVIRAQGHLPDVDPPMAASG